jgi:hypothetical protein
MRTFDEVMTEVQAFAKVPENWGAYLEIRWAAAEDLERDLREWLGEDHGQGISSSDVSCHLTEMIRAGDLVLPPSAV